MTMMHGGKAQSRGWKPLAGLRILIIEDEYFIADELSRSLTRSGAEVVGPASEIQAGLTLLSENSVDCALLDINLRGRSVFPLAEKLSTEGIPWVYLTGYGDRIVPADLRGAAHLEKPIDEASLIEALAGIRRALIRPV